MNLKELVKDIVQDYDSIPKIEINDIGIEYRLLPSAKVAAT